MHLANVQLSVQGLTSMGGNLGVQHLGFPFLLLRAMCRVRRGTEKREHNVYRRLRKEMCLFVHGQVA
jgi:hypothetical protein